MKNETKKSKTKGLVTDKSAKIGLQLTVNQKAQLISKAITKSSRSSTRKLSKMSGSKSDEWSVSMLSDASGTVWNHQASDEEKVDRTLGVASALAEIGPKDPIEGMLAGQMIVVHNAVMASFARASRPGVSPELYEMHMRHAGRLSKTFSALVEALHRHRGKGEQRIVIERVTVNGGQAVVGAVDTGGRGQQKFEEQPHVQQHFESSSIKTVRSEIEEDGETLPAARDAKRQVPSSWRAVSRRTKGK